MRPYYNALPGRRRIALLVSVVAAISACTGSRAWWQTDLDAWRGASTSELLDAWGPPVRTLTEANETTVLVYESSRHLDYRMETLADPSRMVDPNQRRSTGVSGKRGECTLFFEIESGQVAEVRHEGAACDIVPRTPVRQRAP